MKPPSSTLALVRSLTTKKGRARHGKFIAAGARVIGEAIAAKCPIEFLLVSPSDLTSTGRRLTESLRGLKVYEVSSRDFRHIDQASTTQGVLAIVEKGQTPVGGAPALGSRVLALDSINDPSNLGAMIRSALAFGFDQVLLSEGCVELHSPKVIGASAGSIFHLEISEGNVLPAELAAMRDLGYNVVGSSADGEDFYSGTFGTEKLCLVIGNEARGIALETRAVCNVIVRIPIATRCESLSAPVAAGILMHELSKPRAAERIHETKALD
jgi:TrmH family RNA methyltransferase